MARASETAELNALRLKQQDSKPASPAAGYWKAYTKSDGLYLVDSGGTEYGPFGSGSGDVLYSTLQAAQLVNEAQNFPSLELADNAQPEWWEVSANATLTEVDIAGEAGITETYARAHKVVTTADAKYSYQRYTYANEKRVKAGRALSAIFAVWAVGGKAARIRLQSSVGSLGVSADTTAAGWTILKVEGVTLDGTYVEVRCEVDTGTAYFVPLGIHIGAKAIPLRPRALQYHATVANVNLVNDADPGGAYADCDVTASTSSLAVMADICVTYGNATAAQKYLSLRRNGSAITYSGMVTGNPSTSINGRARGTVQLDDGQIFEYGTNAAAGDTEHVWLDLAGWWEWE